MAAFVIETTLVDCALNAKVSTLAFYKHDFSHLAIVLKRIGLCFLTRDRKSLLISLPCPFLNFTVCCLYNFSVCTGHRQASTLIAGKNSTLLYEGLHCFDRWVSQNTNPSGTKILLFMPSASRSAPYMV